MFSIGSLESNINKPVLLGVFELGQDLNELAIIHLENRPGQTAVCFIFNPRLFWHAEIFGIELMCSGHVGGAQADPGHTNDWWAGRGRLVSSYRSSWNGKHRY